MNDKNRNLVVRIVSAVVLLPVVLWLLWAGGWATTALVGLASAIVASEILGIVGLPLSHPAAALSLAASALFAWLVPSIAHTWPAVIALLAGAPVFSLLLLTLLPPAGDLKAAAPRAAFTAMVPAYAGLCLAAVTGLRAMPQGFSWICVALAVTWGNDTGAYFAGRGFGRHKLYPAVSPSKTWEGFAGGMVFSVLACFVIRALAGGFLEVQDCFVLGIGSGILGPLGDLSESMLKRAHGVKDSGRILPGHGGLYDRLDALLFNAPFVFVYAWHLSGPPLGF
jgi:phosphatidate cytidylyltransferase